MPQLVHMASCEQQRYVLTQTHHNSSTIHNSPREQVVAQIVPLYVAQAYSMSMRRFNFNATSSMMSLAKCHPLVTSTSTFLHQCHVIILSPATTMVFLTQTILYLQKLYSKLRVLLNFYLSGCYIWVYIVFMYWFKWPNLA